MIELLFEFIILGIAGGLLGIFYRDCLKVKDMIFYPLFKLFIRMVKSGNKFLGFIAYPLGYCVYCSTFWITMILCILYLSAWDNLPKWQDIAIGIVLAEGVQHIVIVIACRFLIHNHPDLDKHYNEYDKKVLVKIDKD